GDEAVKAVGEFGEVRPRAARQVERRRRQGVGRHAFFLCFFRHAAQCAGQQRLRGGLVDVAFDQHLVGGLRGPVRGGRGEQLALQLRRHERAGGGQEREQRKECAKADHGVLKAVYGRRASAGQATSVVKSFLSRPSARNWSARIAPSFLPSTFAT